MSARTYTHEHCQTREYSHGYEHSRAPEYSYRTVATIPFTYFTIEAPSLPHAHAHTHNPIVRNYQHNIHTCTNPVCGANAALRITGTRSPMKRTNPCLVTVDCAAPIERDRERQRETVRDRERQRERDRERQRERERVSDEAGIINNIM